MYRSSRKPFRTNRMYKLVLALLAGLMIFSLAGCSEVQSPLSPKPKAKVSKDLGGFTAEFIYTKTDNRPLKKQTILLAELLPLTGGTLEGAFVPVLEPSSAPKNDTDENGRVAISMVKPGRYAISLYTPLGPILLQNEVDEKEILIDIKAGEVTDLGKLVVIVEPSLLEE